METVSEAEVLAALAPGHRVWFAEERMPYTVRCRSDRYVICTKPFAPRRTVIYSIIDCRDLMRGPDNLLFGHGYETDEQCASNLASLHDPELDMQLSYRRSITLNIRKTAS